MTVTGSALNRITVNLANPDAAWQMGGVLNLTGNNLLFFDRVFGSEMAVTGVLNISNSRVGILADVAFGGSAVVNFGGGGSQLRLRGDTLIAPGATFNGDGLLINGNGGRMTIADGINLGDAGLRNDAMLVIDEEAGTILVDRFENGSNGTLQIEIGGLLGGDHDSVSTTLGSATLGGQLQVLLINAGFGMFLPQVGDDFTILTAVGGVSGTFASLPDATNVGGVLYDWTVDYNPTTVVLELANIGGLLGDYNANGVVDAADYAVWRDTLGENTFLAADGNQNGVVDAGDYGVWMAHFGNSLVSVAEVAAVPEPTCLALLAFAAVGLLSLHRRR